MKKSGFNTASGKYCCNMLFYPNPYEKLVHVSIPQAVSTVATAMINVLKKYYLDCFNTASGKYCCNLS